MGSVSNVVDEILGHIQMFLYDHGTCVVVIIAAIVFAMMMSRW